VSGTILELEAIIWSEISPIKLILQPFDGCEKNGTKNRNSSKPLALSQVAKG
jgi:hypothetical protein